VESFIFQLAGSLASAPAGFYSAKHIRFLYSILLISDLDDENEIVQVELE